MRGLLESISPGSGDIDRQIDSRNRRHQAFGHKIAEGQLPQAPVAEGIDPAEFYCWSKVCDLRYDEVRTKVPLAPNPLVSYEYRKQYAEYVARCRQEGRRNFTPIGAFRVSRYEGQDQDLTEPRPWVAYLMRVCQQLMDLGTRPEVRGD